MRTQTMAALCLMAAPALAEGPTLSVPADYKTWSNFYANDRVGANEGQFISCYANDIAVDSAANGGEIAYGATLVAELWSVLKDKDGAVAYSALDARIKDAHAATVVMQRIEGADAAYDDGMAVGDWAFAVFNADGTPKGNGDVTACRACHEPLADTQYLFTYAHLAKAIVE